MSTLYEELRQVIEGEVRFDSYSRSLYSTDASMYQIEPIGVVIPRHQRDVVATVDIARRHQVPVLPRLIDLFRQDEVQLVIEPLDFSVQLLLQLFNHGRLTT